MEPLPELTLYLTDACNFSCRYCYQRSGTARLDLGLIRKALDFFLPRMQSPAGINFYGGEQLMAFSAIRSTVCYIEEKNLPGLPPPAYSISTNGSLIDKGILRFLADQSFTVLLSFDGYAQEKSRQSGSYFQILDRLHVLVKTPGISLAVNSVFGPETVGLLSDSMRLIMEAGVDICYLSVDKISPWAPSQINRLKKELALLSCHMKSHYFHTGRIPIWNFRPEIKQGIFACGGGKIRVVLAPDGTLWGCFMAYDYFRSRAPGQDSTGYSFGHLNAVLNNWESIRARTLNSYAGLRMDAFRTEEQVCRSCPDLRECEACPMESALATGIIGKIPQWRCAMSALFRKARAEFQSILPDKP